MYKTRVHLNENGIPILEYSLSVTGVFFGHDRSKIITF